MASLMRTIIDVNNRIKAMEGSKGPPVYDDFSGYDYSISGTHPLSPNAKWLRGYGFQVGIENVVMKLIALSASGTSIINPEGTTSGTAAVKVNSTVSYRDFRLS